MQYRETQWHPRQT